MPDVTLPETLPGHWSTPEGREMAERYAGLTRADLSMCERPDFALANDVYMVDRDDLALIGLQTAAKERIRWLSARLAKADQLLARITAATGDEQLLHALLRLRAAQVLPAVEVEGERLAATSAWKADIDLVVGLLAGLGVAPVASGVERG